MSAAKLDSEPSPSTIRTPVAAAPLSPASPASWETSTRVTATPARLAEISPRSAEAGPAARPTSRARAGSHPHADLLALLEKPPPHTPEPAPRIANAIRRGVQLHRLQQREDCGRLVWRQADVQVLEGEQRADLVRGWEVAAELLHVRLAHGQVGGEVAERRPRKGGQDGRDRLNVPPLLDGQRPAAVEGGGRGGHICVESLHRVARPALETLDRGGELLAPPRRVELDGSGAGRVVPKEGVVEGRGDRRHLERFRVAEQLKGLSVDLGHQQQRRAGVEPPLASRAEPVLAEPAAGNRPLLENGHRRSLPGEKAGRDEAADAAADDGDRLACERRRRGEGEKGEFHGNVLL
mmetsp:Transcript_33090/g.104105  ORF Transcript_33090/g.104105 Transcript_33090/m.104105 type:complete len:351 (+) Transcript_33090:1406-2458(+)